jgi:hypothetical protein
MTKKYLSTTGKRLIRQLFIENRNIGENDLALYTMHREDEEYDGFIYPSLYRLYIETRDITEARFVSEYLYDWEQWNDLASSATYKDEIARWRVELKALVLGELVDTLILDALSNSKSSKSSAKFLVDKLSKNTKGRPTTAVIPTSEETTTTLVSEIAKDLKRLHLQ